MTDVDRRSAGRLMASTVLFKNLIFIKCFGFSAELLLLKLYLLSSYTVKTQNVNFAHLDSNIEC